jgi:hypothetical protein
MIDAFDSEDSPGTLKVEWNIDGAPWQPTTHNSSSGSYVATWDTTAGGNGSKTLTARAIDSNNLAGWDSNTLTVLNPLLPFHVSSIQVVVSPVSGPRNRGVATVIVVDQSGSPVGGVAVSGSFTGDWNGSASALTDSAGQASLQTPPVKNGSNWMFCVEIATKDGWSYGAGANIETCDSTSGGSTVGLVTGRITDASTELPIQSASVSTDTGQSALTDGQGNYQLVSVPTGSRTVTASASGYVSVQSTVNVSDSATSTADFALSPPSGGSGAIKGTVTDSSGTKLGGALVQTDSGQSALTNSGGKYTIQNVPAGTRTVTASKPGFLSQIQTAQLLSGQNLTVDFSLAGQ